MRLNDMVGGWMTDNPVTIAPDRPVIEAYALMAENEVRHLPVVKDGKLVGIVSDRDLHRISPLSKERPAGDVEYLFTTPVSFVMTKSGFVTAEPQTTLAEAARTLVATNIHSLPVLDGEKVVGILSTHDLLRALLGMAREKGAAPPPMIIETKPALPRKP
jgi:acetoin utilization protein AcuB